MSPGVLLCGQDLLCEVGTSRNRNHAMKLPEISCRDHKICLRSPCIQPKLKLALNLAPCRQRGELSSVMYSASGNKLEENSLASKKLTCRLQILKYLGRYGRRGTQVYQ